VENGEWRTKSGTRFFLSVVTILVLFLSSESIGFSRHDVVKHSLSDRPGSHADDSIFALRIAQAKSKGIDTLPIGERVAAMGKLFLGTPYVAGTLDSDSVNEQLVVDLRGFDCVTFYENMLALARIVREYPHPTMKSLQDELTLLRYRHGEIDGYHSRLHYTVDYIFDNMKKRTLLDVTRNVGGSFSKVDDRVINFMTNHRSSYKQLANNDAEYNSMVNIERNIQARKGFYFIPKENIAKVEDKIETGDIMGITTNIPRLDCSHTGIAIRMTDGRVHFMHASNLQGKVIISEEPLADYLTHSSHQTGIIVVRPQETISNTKIISDPITPIDKPFKL